VISSALKIQSLIGQGLDDEGFLVPGLACGIGFNTSVALTLISTAVRPQTPVSWLARDYARLRDPKVRAALSEQEIAAIEERLLKPIDYELVSARPRAS
jgi:hypothetical protein